MHKFKARYLNEGNKDINSNSVIIGKNNIKSTRIHKPDSITTTKNDIIWGINKIFIEPNDEDNSRYIRLGN